MLHYTAQNTVTQYADEDDILRSDWKWQT